MGSQWRKQGPGGWAGLNLQGLKTKVGQQFSAHFLLYSMQESLVLLMPLYYEVMLIIHFS